MTDGNKHALLSSDDGREPVSRLNAEGLIDFRSVDARKPEFHLGSLNLHGQRIAVDYADQGAE